MSAKPLEVQVEEYRAWSVLAREKIAALEAALAAEKHLCSQHIAHTGHECRGCMWAMVEDWKKEHAWQKSRRLEVEDQLRESQEECALLQDILDEIKENGI